MLGRGLDNKVTVYPLSLDEDPTTRKKTVGTHTNYTSCCIFPNSNQQVSFITDRCSRLPLLLQEQYQFIIIIRNTKYAV